MTLAIRRLVPVIVLACLIPFQGAAAQDSASYVSQHERYVIWGDATGTETVIALMEVTGVAAATGVASQSLVDNVLVETESRFAAITDSFNGNVGVFAINQSSGNVNNQANVHAIALVGEDQPALQLVQLSAVQELRGNDLTSSSANVARIDNSFNDTTGVVGVNQASGSLNQQVNMLALTFGRSVGPIMPLVADASLAQIGTDQDNNLNEETTATQEQSVTNSFNNFVGIAQGSAVAGNMNRVANLLSVSVQTIGGP